MTDGVSLYFLKNSDFALVPEWDQCALKVGWDQSVAKWPLRPRKTKYCCLFEKILLRSIIFYFPVVQCFYFWYNNSIRCLPTETGITPLLSLGLSPEQCVSCLLWPLGGVGALGSAREGTHCRVCIMKRDCATAGNLEVPELLLGIYALLCPPWRTLRTVQLLVEAQVGSPTVSSDQVPS